VKGEREREKENEVVNDRIGLGNKTGESGILLCFALNIVVTLHFNFIIYMMIKNLLPCHVLRYTPFSRLNAP
jgi:hypothetical protein